MRRDKALDKRQNRPGEGSRRGRLPKLWHALDVLYLRLQGAAMYRVKRVDSPEWDNVRIAFAVLHTFVCECNEEMEAIEAAWPREAIEDAAEVVEQYYVQHELGDGELSGRNRDSGDAQATFFPLQAAPAPQDAPEEEVGEGPQEEGP